MQIRSMGEEDPLNRKSQPIPVFLPGEFHGQRNLASFSPVTCDTLYLVTNF